MSTLHALGLLLLLVARILPGQNAAPDRISRELSGFGPSARVRVSVDGQRQAGILERFSADSLTLNASSGRTTIAARAIDSLWRQGDRQTKRGTLIGSITGAAAGGLFFAGLANSMDNEAGAASSFAGGAGIGFVAGGLIGAGTGSLVRGWRLAYPRDTHAEKITALSTALPSEHLQLSVNGQRLRGRIVKRSGDTLVFAVEAGRNAITLAQVDTVWRRRSKARHDALYGGVISGGLGALVGWGVATSGGDMTKTGRGLAVGGSIGALGGALIGGLLGRQWEYLAQVYPAR
jgi:hypothetical protein